MAAALRERGVGAGDRVAIMMTNRNEFLETMFAASAIGAIVVPVNFRLAPDEIAYILTDSGASLLVVEEATAAAAASARAACAHGIGFVSTGHVDGADPYFPVSSGPVEPPAADVPEDSPALIMYTSGTTGRPKGAVLTHENLMCQSLTLIRVWRLFADEEVNPGASLTLDELREWGSARLARYRLPTVLHVVDALPRNASGKVMKTALRREYR